MLYGCWVNKCHVVHRTRNGAGVRLLPYSAKFCQRAKWNMVEVETVEAGGRVHGVGARLLPYSASSVIFYQVLSYSAKFCQRGRWNTVEVGAVGAGGRVQGVTG